MASRGGVLACMILTSMPGTASADAYAELVQARLEAVKVLVAQSKEVCDSIPLDGHRNETEVKAEANIKLNTILAKIGKAGGNAAIKDNRVSWQNVVQDKLAGLLKDKASCKSNFVVTMSGAVLTATPPPK